MPHLIQDFKGEDHLCLEVEIWETFIKFDFFKMKVDRSKGFFLVFASKRSKLGGKYSMAHTGI